MPVALITGVSGQDGSYLAEPLLAERRRRTRRGPAGGRRPTAFVDGRVELHSIDLGDLDALDGLVDERRARRIYTLAAVSSVFAVMAGPRARPPVNALPVAQLLESAWRLQESTGRPVESCRPRAPSSSVPDTRRRMRTHADPPHLAVRRGEGVRASPGRRLSLRGLFAVELHPVQPRVPPATRFVTRKITAAAAASRPGDRTRSQLGTSRCAGTGVGHPTTLSARLAAEADAPDDFVIATGTTHSIADFVRPAFAQVGIRDWQADVVLDPAFRRPVDPSEQVGDPSRAESSAGSRPSDSARSWNGWSMPTWRSPARAISLSHDRRAARRHDRRDSDPADRGGVGRYVDELVPALLRAGTDLTVVCRRVMSTPFEMTGARTIAAPHRARGRETHALGAVRASAGRTPRERRHHPLGALHVPTAHPAPRTSRSTTSRSSAIPRCIPDQGHVLPRGSARRSGSGPWWSRRAERPPTSTSPRPMRIRPMSSWPDSGSTARGSTAPAAEVAERAPSRRRPATWIAFLGTLEPRKNVPALIDAYRDVTANRPDAPALLLAGGSGWDDAVDPAIARSRRPRAGTSVGSATCARPPLRVPRRGGGRGVSESR